MDLVIMMGRSTPGTRFRTELVKMLRLVNTQMRYLTYDWTGPGAMGKVSLGQGERDPENPQRWWRKRLEHEYPENRAKVLHETYNRLGDLQTLLFRAQKEVERRYLEVLREQEAAERAAQERDRAAAHRQIHGQGN